MSLIGSGYKNHIAVSRGLEFLCLNQVNDGSWKIVLDLSIWNTTLSTMALGGGNEETRNWILQHQKQSIHPYIGSSAGGWGWTPTDSSLPDSDDTAMALLALHVLPGNESTVVLKSVRNGINWLLEMQNNDGGWPTLCKGWQTMPFDRSCPYMTSHVLRAFLTWKNKMDNKIFKNINAAIKKGERFLKNKQNDDGSWYPLWFGNENVLNNLNPVFGTSRILLYYSECEFVDQMIIAKSIDYLQNSQNSDGSWGGSIGTPGQIEETAIACDALLLYQGHYVLDEIIIKAFNWLCEEINNKGFSAKPIGLYFQSIWYYEELYPVIFSVSALKKALNSLKFRNILNKNT